MGDYMTALNNWKIEYHKKKIPKFNNPILIEGLPGIGNVGKITVDFLIDELKAKKLCTFFSYSFPHSVFVNEKNLVEMPEISLFYIKKKGMKNDILILAGDIQPSEEESCFKFTEIILNMMQEYGCSEIITIGGIGLETIPEDPVVYATANTKEIIEKYNKLGKFDNKIYGVVGPIIGVTGLLLGMSDPQKMQAVAFLAETFGHPIYLGIKGAKKVLKIINKRFKLKIKLNDLENEILKIEEEMMKRKEEIQNVSEQSTMDKFKKKLSKDESSYIG
jgi:uncharacterized protein